MTLLGAPTDHERKRLGQYFTGPTLSRLLASLADSASAARVIDPMAGSGDLVICLLYTSDAADDLLCVDLGGRRIIKKKNYNKKILSDKIRLFIVIITSSL